MQSMSMNYTPEQTAAIDAFKAGKSLVLSAFAGTGKTTTLKGMGLAAPDRKGLYLAFGKDIQLDAEKSFPSNVECRTAHSLAYGWMVRQPGGRQILAKIKANRSVPSWTTAKILGIPYNGFSYGEVGMTQRGVAGAVMTTVDRFCRSADTEIAAKHAPREFEGDEQAQFATFIAGFARKAWADVISPNGKLRFSMNVYLKLYVMSNPDLSARYDFILFDEAQDANPCIAQIVMLQADRCQIIMVGDSNQAIYGWNGAVDAMATFEADEHLMITQSFRFGLAIAAEANKFLALLGAEGQVKGFDVINSEVTAIENPDAILCRTNAEAIAQAMDAQARGLSVALCGGTKDIERFVRAAEKMMAGRKVEHEDLLAFESWADVVAHAKEDEGRDIRVMVNLIENYGTQAILDVCESSVDEDDADLVVSTAHKSKGREWDRVRIAPDFKAPEDGNEPRRDEMMLMYVAVTRAKLALDRTGVAWIDRFVEVTA